MAVLISQWTANLTLNKKAARRKPGGFFYGWFFC